MQEERKRVLCSLFSPRQAFCSDLLTNRKQIVHMEPWTPCCFLQSSSHLSYCVTKAAIFSYPWKDNLALDSQYWVISRDPLLAMYYSRVFKPHSVPGRKCSLPASVTGYQPLIHYSTCWSKATHSLSLCLDRRGWCVAAAAGLWLPMTSLFWLSSRLLDAAWVFKIKQFVVNFFF